MRAETVLKRVSRDEEQWAQQLFREKAAMDYRSGMGAARNEGEAAGLAKGRQEGIIIGRSEGIAAGDARGFERARLEIARKMKLRGWSLADIAEDTGLSPETIVKL